MNNKIIEFSNMEINKCPTTAINYFKQDEILFLFAGKIENMSETELNNIAKNKQTNIAFTKYLKQIKCSIARHESYITLLKESHKKLTRNLNMTETA